jgi:HSP20 family protein
MMHRKLLLKLCHGLVDIVNLLTRTDKNDGGLKEHNGKFGVKGLCDDTPSTYGFNMRSGLDGSRPRVWEFDNMLSTVEAMLVVDDQPFGNVGTRELSPVVDVLRKPMTAVFDVGNEIIITAKLPNVLEIEIVTILDGNILIIKANGANKYATEIMLPEAVSATRPTQSYNNGLLKIRVKKATLGIGGKENDK